MGYTKDQEEFLQGVKNFIYDDFPRKEYLTLQGPPGSGKTYLITQLPKEFKDKSFHYVAYTGKAVDNLMKKDVQASTIYSTFYTVDREAVELSFILNNKNTRYPFEVLVIDEVSMLSQQMFNDLLTFGIKIIAVGDRNQLGPVKAEMNHLLDNPDYELRTIHRQEETSGIIRLANQYAKTHTFPGFGRYSEDVEIISRDSVTADMILSVNQTICGTNETREKWNSIIRRTHKHYDYFPEPGERVICCRNTPIVVGNRRVINGTTGTVTRIKCKGGNDLLLTFRPDWANEDYSFRVNGENFISGNFKSAMNVYCFDFAYVVTVNKAQGSEWDSVLYIVDKEIPGESFYRNVNTGITRAKKKLILAY